MARERHLGSGRRGHKRTTQPLVQVTDTSSHSLWIPKAATKSRPPQESPGLEQRSQTWQEQCDYKGCISTAPAGTARWLQEA